MKEQAVLTPDKFEDLLLYFSKSIFEGTSEEEVVWDLARNCIGKLGFIDCMVYLVDEEAGELVQSAALGEKVVEEGQILNPMRIPLGSGISGSVAITGVGEIVPDTLKDPRYLVDDKIRNSEIAVPILIGGKVVGVIDCEHSEKGFFTQQHLRILSAVAGFCAIRLNSLRNAKKAAAEQQRLLQLEREMADLKMRAFHAQMNPHFIFNTVNAIQHYITTNDRKASLHYLSVFSKLLRYFLKNIQKESALLVEEIEMLKWYLEIQGLRYGKQFASAIEIDGAFWAENAQVPVLVVQQLMDYVVETRLARGTALANLKILLEAKERDVILKVRCSCKATAEEKKEAAYSPLLDWQNYIDLLNHQYGYQIQYQVMPCSQEQNGEVYIMQMPNLA